MREEFSILNPQHSSLYFVYVQFPTFYKKLFRKFAMLWAMVIFQHYYLKIVKRQLNKVSKFTACMNILGAHVNKPTLNPKPCLCDSLNPINPQQKFK
jgi:hypothetical protein